MLFFGCRFGVVACVRESARRETKPEGEGERKEVEVEEVERAIARATTTSECFSSLATSLSLSLPFRVYYLRQRTGIGDRHSPSVVVVSVFLEREKNRERKLERG